MPNLFSFSNAANESASTGSLTPTRWDEKICRFFSVRELQRINRKIRKKMGSTVLAKAHAVLLASALALSWPHGTVAADPPRIAPEGPVWVAGGGFQFNSKPNKKRESLSGIACPALSAATPRLCVAVFDEGGEARYVAVDRDRIMPQPEKIVLLPGNKELDGEGAARDVDTVYVTGSHSPKRGDCAVNPDGRHVFRFKVDGATGREAPLR
jgi:hypothetical protein